MQSVGDGKPFVLHAECLSSYPANIKAMTGEFKQKKRPPQSKENKLWSMLKCIDK